MTDPASRDWRAGCRRLIKCLDDLGVEVAGHIALGEANEEHRNLFKLYVEELEPSIVKAQAWFNGMIEVRVRRARCTREQAVEKAWIAFPAGPSSDPQFVSLIRNYWLATIDVNANVEPSRRVGPHHFLLSWLEEINEFEKIQYLSYLPYWPIGLDENENWC